MSTQENKQMLYLEQGDLFFIRTDGDDAQGIQVYYQTYDIRTVTVPDAPIGKIPKALNISLVLPEGLLNQLIEQMTPVEEGGIFIVFRTPDDNVIVAGDIKCRYSSTILPQDEEEYAERNTLSTISMEFDTTTTLYFPIDFIGYCAMEDLQTLQCMTELSLTLKTNLIYYPIDESFMDGDQPFDIDDIPDTFN